MLKQFRAPSLISNFRGGSTEAADDRVLTECIVGKQVRGFKELKKIGEIEEERHVGGRWGRFSTDTQFCKDVFVQCVGGETD